MYRIINGLAIKNDKTERNNGAKNDKTERNNGVKNDKTERNNEVKNDKTERNDEEKAGARRGNRLVQILIMEHTD